MKWLDNKIMVISFVWWLLQGSLLLLNELRVWFECGHYGPTSFILLNISLIVVSFLLFYIKNKYIILLLSVLLFYVRKKYIVLLLSILLFLYSIVSLIFCTIVFVLESQGHNWDIILLIIPVASMLLSSHLVTKGLKGLNKG